MPMSVASVVFLVGMLLLIVAVMVVMAPHVDDETQPPCNHPALWSDGDQYTPARMLLCGRPAGHGGPHLVDPKYVTSEGWHPAPF